MSIPPQPTSSHNISNRLYLQFSSKFSTALSVTDWCTISRHPHLISSHPRVVSWLDLMAHASHPYHRHHLTHAVNTQYFFFMEWGALEFKNDVNSLNFCQTHLTLAVSAASTPPNTLLAACRPGSRSCLLLSVPHLQGHFRRLCGWYHSLTTLVHENVALVLQAAVHTTTYCMDPRHMYTEAS